MSGLASSWRAAAAFAAALVGGAIAGAGAAADGREFRPPSAAERIAAAGSLAGLSPLLRAAFTPGDDFEPIPRPGPSDWLANHAEEGQDFAAFRAARRREPNGRRRRVYLVPIGKFPAGRSPAPEVLRAYAAAFFGLRAKLLPALSVEKLGLTTRPHPFAGRQILTADVLRALRERMPADAFCLIAVTMEDLYPADDWNFVFGSASLRHGVGVFGFSRYREPTADGSADEKRAQRKLLARSLRTMTHEIAHVFGLRHCIYYSCLVNGSNHLEESDSRPLFLCPVCLRKLHSVVRFDVAARYRALARILRQQGLEEPAAWATERVETLRAATR